MGRNSLPQRGLASITIDGRDGRFRQGFLPRRSHSHHCRHHVLAALCFLLGRCFLFPLVLVLIVVVRNQGHRHSVVSRQSPVVRLVGSKPERSVLRRHGVSESSSSLVRQKTHDSPFNGLAIECYQAFKFDRPILAAAAILGQEQASGQNDETSVEL